MLVAQIAVDPDDVARQLRRIIESPLFRDAPIQQRLLRFLVEEALRGHAEDLKEYTLGLSVFHRGVDFDPKTDSIVRVQVSILRRKLTQYYAHTARADEVVVEVPRGSYVAVFRPPAPEQPAPSAATPANRPPWMRPVLGLLVVFALAGAFVAGRYQAMTVRTSSSAEVRTHPLWTGLLTSGARTQLVLGVPLFFRTSDGLYVRHTHLNSPEDPEYQHLSSTLRQRLGELTANEVYTGIGEAAAISHLSTFFHEHTGTALSLVRNRQVRAQDLATTNLVIVASAKFHTLREELRLPMSAPACATYGRARASRRRTGARPATITRSYPYGLPDSRAGTS